MCRKRPVPHIDPFRPLRPGDRSLPAPIPIGHTYTKKDILLCCPALPVEVIAAASLRPVIPVPDPFVSGVYAGSPHAACPFIRGIFHTDLPDALSGAGGLIIADFCSQMSEPPDGPLDIARDVPIIRLDMPKGGDGDPIDLFTDRLRRFADELCRGRPGSRVTSESLRRTIRTYNAVRRQRGRLRAMMDRPDSALTGTEVFRLISMDYASRPREFTKHFRKTIAEIERKNDGVRHKRIMITVCSLIRPDLITIVEGLGARVTALDTCREPPDMDTIIAEESADPMRAIAEYYLMRPRCPNTVGVRERTDRLLTRVGSSSIDGVIISLAGSCGGLRGNAPVAERRLRAANVPVLVIEDDYESSYRQRVVMRVETFLNSIELRETDNV